MNAQNVPLTGIVAQYGLIKNGVMFTGNINYDTLSQIIIIEKDADWEISLNAEGEDVPFSIKIWRGGEIMLFLDGIGKGAQINKTARFSQFKDPLKKGDSLIIKTANCKTWYVAIKEVSQFIVMATTLPQPKSEVVKMADQIVGEIPDMYQIKAGTYSLKWEEKERYFTATTDGTLKLVEGQWYFNDALVVF